MLEALQKKLRQFQLDGKNADRLKKVGELLIPELDGVLENFYDRAAAEPDWAAFFDGPQRMDFARSAQKKHWELLLTANFGEDYLASVDRIGRTHARIHLPLDAYMSAYSLATSDLITVFMKKSRIGFVQQALPEIRTNIGVMTRAFSLDIERVVETTFRVQAEEQSTAFSYINDAIEKMATGDLTQLVPGPDESDFPRDFNPVRLRLNEAMQELGNVLGGVSSTMQGLQGIVDEVNAAAEELSNRTASQAAALEETAAAVHELTQNVTQSSKNTERAKEVAHDAARSAEEGAQTVTEASEAMGRIQTSSDRITQIIGLIEDIAFQTNLLALNAGVEAARAGPAGRGFAVVAEEVRGLAGNASDAARQIKDLVSQSSSEVSSGVELIQTAARTLTEIVTNFDHVAELTGEVATAAHAQSTALGEVNAAVSQVDTVTQKNAAMVDQTTGVTNRMHRQAEDVYRILAAIKVAQDPAQMAPPQSSQPDRSDEAA